MNQSNVRPRRPTLAMGKVHPGFTLMELIVAVVLSVIASACVLVAGRQIITASNDIRDDLRTSINPRLIGDQMRRDFIHADRIQWWNDGIQLSGLIHRDTSIGTPTGRSATVRYQVVPISQGQSKRTNDRYNRWLLRHQWQTDPLTGRMVNYQVEPISDDIGRLDVTHDLWQDDLRSDVMPPVIRIRLTDSRGMEQIALVIRHHEGL
ncbi:pilus assembly FimT family protein [Crateriforma conspicua]|uniref:Uncharacterized protein n=1 Tax=Crateriforma conspicua TaxID=2527996 RepID=A0A5C5YAQ4_9PLAN|nr:prepilin-type N-terminal cleavage/methylation domain-containing protein [Crateriforma conspicua]TWT72018.1 hypothetical protein Pan14r_43350 [Crateriforma conspicua]